MKDVRWTRVTQDRDKWWTFVKTAVDLRNVQKVDIFEFLRDYQLLQKNSITWNYAYFVRKAVCCGSQAPPSSPSSHSIAYSSLNDKMKQKTASRLGNTSSVIGCYSSTHTHTAQCYTMSCITRDNALCYRRALWEVSLTEMAL